MTKRRGTVTLGPQDNTQLPNSAHSTHIFPQQRANSPSFAQFLSKPGKWFNRSSSTSKIPTHVQEPRPSTSSVRKPKISHPTDPRPILENYSVAGSKSVLDVSSRPLNSLDLGIPPSPSTPNSAPSYAQGDLRNISKRSWSRSADDLSKVSPTKITINTSFQDRVAQYRQRTDSNASGLTPGSTPSSPMSLRPFPSTPLSSSPPQAIAHAAGVSISISSPNNDNQTQRQPTMGEHTHVHTRSHSFTPKLPSKLSTPRLVPTSPQRKGSGNSERDIDMGHGRTSPSAHVSSRGAFPFNLASSKGETSTAPRPPTTTLLAPPAIIEPDDVQTEGTKRTSQIVYNSGFINRLIEPPSHSINWSMAKGWKPFKMELKGSKLYFFKPPSDRSTAIKELFPTEIVPQAAEEEVEAVSEPAASSRDGATKETNNGRRKRAFWGRQTHPDLVKNNKGKAVAGTFEALVHETVFATTFPSASLDDADSSLRPADLPWKDFAASVVFCLPLLVGKEKFEAEFLRRGGSLIDGADEQDLPSLELRLSWLASWYLYFHAEPVDSEVWRSWCESNGLTKIDSGRLLPSSASTKGLFVPTPNLGAGESPNLSTFSPRPDTASMASPLMDVVFDFEPTPNTPALTSSPSLPTQAPPPLPIQSSPSLPVSMHKSIGSVHIPWSTLENEGLTREVFLALDPHLIARSLTLFHKSCMDAAPDDIVEGLLREWADSQNDLPPSPSLFDHLFGTEESPHWLTKLLLLQILGSDRGRTSEEQGPSSNNSRMHSRSGLISGWVRVGEICRLSGDECSWKAIQAALCSRPIARLEKVWKRVDSQAWATIQQWVALSETSTSSTQPPRATIWGGDVRVQLSRNLAMAKSGDVGDVWKVTPLCSARLAVERFKTTFDASGGPIDNSTPTEDLRRMADFWKDKAAEGGGSGGYASKFIHISQFMSLSQAAEPRRKGQFEPYFWSKASSAPHTTTSPLIPLLFPELLPSISFIDRSQLLRGRIDSDNVENSFIPNIDIYLRPKDHRPIRQSQSANRRSLLDDVSLFQNKTLIPHDNGELLLVVHPSSHDSQPPSRSSSQVRSRPSSSVFDPSVGEKAVGRSPSIRVKPSSSSGVERRPSALRRSSLPALSQKHNHMFADTSHGPPLRVKVQAGTLNSLVNVLVNGLRRVSVSFADDNGETSLGGGKTRELYVDHASFAKVWWNVYRSFVTPLVFFELLRKLYITTAPPPPSPSATDCTEAAEARSRVLETMQEWLSIGGGAQDALDDSALYDAVQAFLVSDMDHSLALVEEHIDESVQMSWSHLQQTLAGLKTAFRSNTLRPSIRHPSAPRNHAGLSVTRMRSMSTKEVPDVDQIDAENLVDNLDGMAFAALTNVTEEDLLAAMDVLEIQSVDRTAWFTHKDPPMTEDVVELQTIHSHIQEVEPSTLLEETMQDSVYRLLPPSVRSCIRAFGVIRKWLLSKIVEPKVGLRTRQYRMELFLQALEIARMRSPDACSSDDISEKPCIRSTVEAAICSAIVSVESRAHQRAWQNVAANRGVTCDSLMTLLQRRNVEAVQSREFLTVDMGWVIERLLEIISTPDVVDSQSHDSHNLVNFDKRRNMCSFVANIVATAKSIKSTQRDLVVRRGFERLSHAERETYHIHFDLKAIKEEVQREQAQAPSTPQTSARKVARPFQRLALAQIEKNKRDKAFRSRFQREKSAEQTRIDKREEVVNKAMRPRKLTTRQHRNKKSVSSLFGTFMRPLSTAFGAESTHAPGIKRTPSELDFVPSGKPALVLSLVDARCVQFINAERSFTFQLDTEDGGHYLLQALNKKDMTKWISTIDKVAKMAAKRRLTYIGSPKPQVEDHMQGLTTLTSMDPLAVFQVDLESLLKRETGLTDPPPGTIPNVVEQCLAEVEQRGLTEVGIYRIAGMTSEVQALRDAFNRGEQSPIQPTTDIHVVCDLLKSWFRVLPDPVFPSSSYHRIIEATKLENLDDRLVTVRSIVQGLPQANYDLLKRISEHLDKVTDFEEANHMTAEALSIVFSPNLLRAPHNDFAMVLANMTFTHKLVKMLITHFNVIFDEGEAEGEPEDDFVDPIVEEDEEDSPL